MELMGPHPNAMEQVFKNPLVLVEIFQYVDVGGKNLRLVCKLWNEIVLSLPKPKLTLNLSCKDKSPVLTCFSSQPFQMSCFNMNPKLTRRVLLCDSISNDENDMTRFVSNTEPNAAKLLHLCDKFSDHVQFMELSMVNTSIPTLFHVLQHSCPNLASISITINDEYHLLDIGPEIETTNMVPLQLRPKLYTIEICISEVTNDIMEIDTTQLHQLAQKIINSATNLQKLKLPYGFYPDLSVNDKLRSMILEHDVPKNEDGGVDMSGSSGYNLVGLVKMLTQVASHLEALQLKCTRHCHNQEEYNAECKPELMFRMPMMPKLKVFKNQLIDVLSCGNLLQDICSSRLKSLTTLTLGNYDASKSLDKLVKNISASKNLFSNGTSGVTSLSLYVVCDPSSLSTLKIPFPFLTTLSVIAPSLKPLQACSSLGLQHLSMYLTSCPTKVSGFIKSFSDNSEWFKSLKTFDIWYIDRKGKKIEDDMTEIDMDTFKQVLKTLAELESITIHYVFGDEKAKVIEPFIQDNKLPVKIKYIVRGIE